MWHGHYFWSAWPMLTGGFLFWGSLIGLVAWGFHRSTRRSEGTTTYGRFSLDRLKERYAKGEITKAQFEEMKRDLLE